MEDLPKLLNSMKVGADRIQKIVVSLRTFSRMDEAEMKEVDIHDGINSTLMILQSRIKAHDERPAIEIVKDYGNLPPVECYAGQLNQVFMNILSNAIDALEESFASSVKHAELNEGVSTPDAQLLTLNSGTELEFVIMVIAVSCVKLLSAHNSTQHTSRKHKV
jgi:PAS/PAC sensor signal transduction histidine kinase (EC 2.7.13.3)